MTLIEKLNTISNPKLPGFSLDKAQTVEDYWNKFIEPRLPKNIEIVIKWHKVLKEYVKEKDSVLGFRTGNVAGHLRRGWETITTDGYSFFYTDNYFSHYFYKLAYDGDYIPELNEFSATMKSKKFPVRFSSYMGTKDEPHEREYAAFNVDGKNPGIGTAGYKLAHIIDAGKNYCIGNQILGLAEICKTYFDLGDVSDWKKNPKTNMYCRDNFVIPENKKTVARKLAEACFLRMVHPMNYFVSPKSHNQGKTYNMYSIDSIEKNNIAEEPIVLSFVRQKFHDRYTVNGIDYFQDFLNLVYPLEDSINENGSTVLNICYSPEDLSLKIKPTFTPQVVSKVINNTSQLKNTYIINSKNDNLQMALEYLSNPNTSFRKLEKEIMLIDSPARGGGFKSKTIINNLGITAEKKGILSRTSIEDEILKATGKYKETLSILKGLLKK